jgi:hypothetical protein
LGLKEIVVKQEAKDAIYLVISYSIAVIWLKSDMGLLWMARCIFLFTDLTAIPVPAVVVINDAFVITLGVLVLYTLVTIRERMK